VKTKRCINRAFTLIEVLLVIAGISAIGAVGYVATSNAKATAESVKLESDVKSINQAIDLYRANGGQIAANSTANAVLAKLKTRADSASAGTSIGMKSSFVDVRTEAEWQSSSEALTGQLRAVWDPAALAFSTSAGTTLGIKRFTINNSLASAAPATETRDQTLQGAASGWVWGHSASSAPVVASGSSPQTGSVGTRDDYVNTYSLLPNTTPNLVVTGNGTVGLPYVYDGAGYEGQLAAVSARDLERFDTTTQAGRILLYQELVRRALSNSTLGGLLLDSRVDRTSSTPRTHQFEVGDSLIMILIPNGSFEQARDFLATNNPSNGSNIYPLTSIILNTGDQSDFSSSQMVSLGRNTYAFEDLIGGGDEDFEDIIFKLDNVQQTEWATTRQVDPNTYYAGNPYWNTANTSQSWFSSISIKEALTNAGTIDP